MRHSSRDRVRRRIQRVRVEVEAFEPINHQQEQLQALVLEMLDYTHRLRACPDTPLELASNQSSRDQQARWWAAAMAYRRVLFSPVLASRQARSAFARVITARWPDVVSVAARIVRGE